MKQAPGLLAPLVLLLSGSLFPAAGQSGDTLSVLTRNQYFGADIYAVATAPDADAFLAAARAALMEMAANNFPERAQALAREIAERQPHIVGLQEVVDLRLNGFNTGGPPFVNQLTLTLQALNALGADYDVVAKVRNMALEVPVDLDGDGAVESVVNLTDYDVILARRGLVQAGRIAAVPLGSVCDYPSEDGCNFSVRLEAQTALGQINVDRGFVAVDVTLAGRTFRVVNTHLEIETLGDDPYAPLIQSAQATELKAIVEALSNGESIVVIGDINSTPVDPFFPDPVFGPFVRPFQQFALGVDMTNAPTPGGPYTDAWTLRPGTPPGGTCCNEDLSSPDFSVWEQKDVVFTRDLPLSLKANVFGNDASEKTPSGLWPSDHAGLWVRFKF